MREAIHVAARELPLHVEPVEDGVHCELTTRGRYQVCMELASGGMGTVHLALYRGVDGFERVVALKRMHPELARQKHFVEMFFDEAQALARVQHPNVCALLDLGTFDNTYFLAMDYLEGEPLSAVWYALAQTPALCSGERLPFLIARVFARLCDGLQAVHQTRDERGELMRLVHCDISPQNLFVLYDGSVRLMDFGAARARSGMLHQERPGMAHGKLPYMAPEQLDGQEPDLRFDIWSMGVTMWELLTGQSLFDGRTAPEIIEEVKSRRIPLASEENPRVPAKLASIVQRTLMRDPAARFASARELSAALEAFLSEAGECVPAAEVSAWLDGLFAHRAQERHKLRAMARAIGDHLLPPSVRPFGELQSPAPQLADPAASARTIQLDLPAFTGMQLVDADLDATVRTSMGQIAAAAGGAGGARSTAAARVQPAAAGRGSSVVTALIGAAALLLLAAAARLVLVDENGRLRLGGSGAAMSGAAGSVARTIREHEGKLAPGGLVEPSRLGAARILSGAGHGAAHGLAGPAAGALAAEGAASPSVEGAQAPQSVAAASSAQSTGSQPGAASTAMSEAQPEPAPEPTAARLTAAPERATQPAATPGSTAARLTAAPERSAQPAAAPGSTAARLTATPERAMEPAAASVHAMHPAAAPEPTAARLTPAPERAMQPAAAPEPTAAHLNPSPERATQPAAAPVRAMQSAAAPEPTAARLTAAPERSAQPAAAPVHGVQPTAANAERASEPTAAPGRASTQPRAAGPAGSNSSAAQVEGPLSAAAAREAASRQGSAAAATRSAGNPAPQEKRGAATREETATASPSGQRKQVPAKPTRAAPAASRASSSGYVAGGSVLVLTKPGPAYIIFQGRQLGKSPTRVRLPVGDHKLQLKPVAGGRDVFVDVHMEDGWSSIAQVKLDGP